MSRLCVCICMRVHVHVNSVLDVSTCVLLQMRTYTEGFEASAVDLFSPSSKRVPVSAPTYQSLQLLGRAAPSNILWIVRMPTAANRFREALCCCVLICGVSCCPPRVFMVANFTLLALSSPHGACVCLAAMLGSLTR